MEIEPTNQAVISSAEEAKEYVMNLPLQPWPKIPRAFRATRYDELAGSLVQGRVSGGVREIDCRVVEHVFGLDLQFEGDMARWRGTRIATRASVFHAVGSPVVPDMLHFCVLRQL
jgi:hypothetical protein